jgi:hypothetical protein
MPLLSDDVKAEQLLAAAGDTANAKALARVAGSIRAGGQRSMEWAEPALVLPEQVYELAILLYPDLSAKDKPTKVRAWKWFLNSPMAAPYRTHPNARRRF